MTGGTEGKSFTHLYKSPKDKFCYVMSGLEKLSSASKAGDAYATCLVHGAIQPRGSWCAHMGVCVQYRSGDSIGNAFLTSH